MSIASDEDEGWFPSLVAIHLALRCGSRLPPTQLMLRFRDHCWLTCGSLLAPCCFSVALLLVVVVALLLAHSGSLVAVVGSLLAPAVGAFGSHWEGWLRFWWQLVG